MQSLTSFVVAISFIACGGGSKNPTIDAAVSDDSTTIDSSTQDAFSGTCDPLGNQGCATGQKCTWIEVQETPERIGKLGCVPDGSVALDAACSRGPVGDETGYDNCAAGGICLGASGSATCKDICGFDGSANASCAPGAACTRYQGLGANGGDDPVIGACSPTCDPLKQTRIVNGVTQSCGTGQGCYLLTSSVDTVAVCANAGTVTHNQPIVGTAYPNSCAPGHLPRQAV